MYKQIIDQRPTFRKGIDPIWKLKITDEEYNSLKIFIKENFQNIRKVRKEAVLFFAEWWKREYNGGPHRKIDVARSLFMEDVSDDLFDIAKEGAEILKFTYIKGENTRYLDTMLLQGGLPLKALASNDGNNRYRNYLNGIIKYIGSHYVHWENTDFIQNFNQYISPSFQNEVMYNLTLSIVKAIQYDDESLFPFNSEEGQFIELVESLKATKKGTTRNFRRNPFRVNWLINKSSDRLNLFYEVDFDYNLAIAWINKNIISSSDTFPRMKLVINDQIVNTFIRKNNGDYSAKFKNKINGVISDYGQSSLKVQLISNTNQVFDIHAQNSELPDLTNPMVFTNVIEGKTDSENRWLLVNTPGVEQKNAIAFSKEWVSTSENCKQVNFHDVILHWCEFTKEINLANTISDEEIRFDSNFSLEYNVDFGIQVIDWVKKSNYIIIETNPEIKVFDFEDNRIRSKDYQITYKVKSSPDWYNYNPDLNLPIGLIEFKVFFLKNKTSIRKKLYHLGKADYQILKASEHGGIVQWNWQNGSILPLVTNEKVSIVSLEKCNNWRISYTGDMSVYPINSTFELTSKDDSSTKLKIEVTNPFEGIILLNPLGMPVNEQESICINALLGYRCLVLGKEKVPVQIEYYINEYHQSPDSRVDSYFHNGVENPLYLLEDDIITMYRINSPSIMEYYDKGKYYLVIDERRYRLNVFNGDTSLKGDKFYITNYLDTKVEHYIQKLFSIPVNCSPFSLNVTEFIPKEDGGFAVNKNECYLDEMVVFSQMRSNDYIQVRPRYYNTREALNAADIDIEERKASHSKKIMILKNELQSCNFDDQRWQLILKYFENAVTYNLPFETFIHLTAISRDKRLMVKFYIFLLENLKMDNHQIETSLIRFENEYAQAWHWIPIKIWNEEVSNIIDKKELPEDYKKITFDTYKKRIISLLSFHAVEDQKESYGRFLGTQFIGNVDKSYIPNPSPAELQTLKQKFNNGNGIYIPKYISDIYPNIPKQYWNLLPVNRYELHQWGGLILSPLFAALAFSGVNVFKHNEYWQYQRVLYYMHLDPEWYYDIFQRMVKRIQQNN